MPEKNPKQKSFFLKVEKVNFKIKTDFFSLSFPGKKEIIWFHFVGWTDGWTGKYAL